MNQAELSRQIRALIKPLQAAGLHIASVKVAFTQGVPVVEVTTGNHSGNPARRRVVYLPYKRRASARSTRLIHSIRDGEPS